MQKENNLKSRSTKRGVNGDGKSASRHVHLARSSSSTVEPNEVMSEEAFLQKYLVGSMISSAKSHFSPVTRLIKNIVDGTNYTQRDTFSFGDQPSADSQLFGVTLDSGHHLKTKFWDIFRKARGTAMVALTAPNGTKYAAKDYKKVWLENPSSVINKCSSFTGEPVRTKSAGATTTQLNAVNSLKELTRDVNDYTGLIPIPTSTTDERKRKEALRKIYPKRSEHQQIRCCICGLGEPPALTDIEHVVSSQLLIWLGINPGIRSAKEFGESGDVDDEDGEDDIVSVASDLAFGKIRKKDKLEQWIQTISKQLNPTGTGTGGENPIVNNIIRSMFRPAHETCNRHIKCEHSPFTTNSSGEIISKLDTSIKIKKVTSTYKTGVIIKSIDDTIAKSAKIGIPKPSPEAIEDHKQKWIEIQEKEFTDIAEFLNTIDQQTKHSSYMLLDDMAKMVARSSDPKELSAFRDFILSLLGRPDSEYTKNDDITTTNMEKLEKLIYDNREELAEILALINKTILSRFMYCVHKSDNVTTTANKGTGNSQTDSVFSPTQSSAPGSSERGSIFGETPESIFPVKVKDNSSPTKPTKLFDGGRKTKKRIRKTKKRKMNKKSKTRRRRKLY